METLHAGDLAFYDTLCCGLIPCKVLSIEGAPGPASSSQSVTFRLTAARRAYKRGEILTDWALHVVPRKAVYGKYRNRIAMYNVAP